MNLRNILTGAALAALLGVGACGQEAAREAAPTEAAKEAAGKETLAEGLSDANRFKAAVKAAGLDATLSGPGPYTVLVPTDAAFDKMPKGALDTLMKPESRADLS